MMGTMNISINRTGSLMSQHIPYEVWFKDTKLGKILKSGDGAFTVNREKGVLKIREFGSSMAFHTIQKEIVIFPEHITDINKGIECNVVASLNWLGVFTLGLFAPIRKINIELKY